MSKSKKYNFKDENDEPLSPQPKNETKKGKYDFNSFPDDEKPAVLNADTMNTVDSLGKKTTIHPFSDHQKINLSPAGFAVSEKKSLEMASITTEVKIQKEDAQLALKNTHADDVTYIEKLFLQILNGEQKIAFTDLIIQLKNSGNDNFVKEQAFLYLLICNILKEDFEFIVNNSYTKIEKSTIPFNQNKLENLKKWAIYVLRKRPELKRLVVQKKLSQKWIMLAQNRIDQLVNQLLSQNHFDQAILVSNIQDKTFLQSFEFGTSKIMKKEFTLLKNKQLSCTPKSAWIIDFSIIFQYFDTSSLALNMKQLCQKYQNSARIFLPSLIALVFHFSERDINEEHVQKIIFQDKNFSYLDQVLHLRTLKEYKSQYPKLYNEVVKKIITKIHNSALFVELMIFSEFDEANIKISIETLFQKNEYFSQNRDKSIQILNKAIMQKVQNLETQHLVQVEVLYQWMQCQNYLRLFEKKKYIESAIFFCKNFELITNSNTHDKRHLLQTLIRNIAKFELACSYKQQKQRQYYKILQQLRPNLTNDTDVQILQGCMAFAELRLKAFCLNDKGKLQNLFQLFKYLKAEKTKNDSSGCYSASIRKALEIALTTIDGKIYLSQLAEQQPNKKETAKAIKAGLRQQQIIHDEKFMRSSVFKLLEILGWNQAIGNSIMIKLLF